jgi:methylmalonyl-CoA mutase N-terminal domain/subunit
MKIFAYTLGGALAAQEPQNNITRIAYEALAAVLGGVQTLATSSWDEAHSLPSEEAAHVSLRAQQILAHETGVAKVADPLGGSYYIETLTDALESEIAKYLADILERGGAVAAIDSGFIEDELARSAYRDYENVRAGKRLIVGANFKPRAEDANWTPSFAIARSVADEAVTELRRVRSLRDGARVARALEAAREAAAAGANTIPALIEAARARASIGEMTDALAGVFGRHASSVERGIVAVPRDGADAPATAT